MKVRLEKQTEELTEKVIGAAFEVLNELGHGFLEGVYQRALTYELALKGLSVKEQVAFQILYKDSPVGNYYADMVVENRVIVELKNVDKIVPVHVGQVVNYLRASGISVGLLLNFNKPRLEYRRILL